MVRANALHLLAVAAAVLVLPWQAAPLPRHSAPLGVRPQMARAGSTLYSSIGVDVIRLGKREVHVETLKLSAKEGSTDPHHVVMFPGNPSVLPYYRSFAESIHDGLGQRIAVDAVSHAGFGEVDHNQGTIFDLNEQVELKLGYLDALLSRKPDARLMLMGHSVGGYVMMQILKRRPDLPIVYNVFLFPVLRDLRVALPIQVLQVPIIRELVSATLSAIPAVFKHALVSVIPSLRSEAKMVTDYFHRTTIRNGLYLTRHELDVIQDLDEQETAALQRVAEKSLYLFTTKDAYVPPHVYERVRSIVPDAESHLYEDVEHSFVMDHSDIVAERVLQTLRPALTGLLKRKPSFQSNTIHALDA